MSHSTKNISRESSKNRKVKRQATWARAQTKKNENIQNSELARKKNIDFIRENNITQIYVKKVRDGKFVSVPLAPGKLIRVWRRVQEGKTQHESLM